MEWNGMECVFVCGDSNVQDKRMSNVKTMQAHKEFSVAQAFFSN